MPKGKFAYEFVPEEDIHAFHTKINELLETYGTKALTVELPADRVELPEDLKHNFRGCWSIRTDEGPQQLKVEFATYDTIVLRIDCVREGKRVFRVYPFKVRKKEANDL